MFKACRIVHQDLGFFQYDETPLDVVLASEAQERERVLVEALEGMVNSGIEFDDKRLPDITMQVDRRNLDQARAALVQVKGG